MKRWCAQLTPPRVAALSKIESSGIVRTSTYGASCSALTVFRLRMHFAFCGVNDIISLIMSCAYESEYCESTTVIPHRGVSSLFSHMRASACGKRVYKPNKASTCLHRAFYAVCSGRAKPFLLSTATTVQLNASRM